jgi:nitroreductase
MDVYEAIEKRRTIRGFARKTTEELVRKLILAGSRSISADNSQPWEFVVIDDPGLIEQIAEQKYRLNLSVHSSGVAKQQKSAYKNCNVVAACYKDGGGYLWSMWSCVENIALAATAEGLGIVPSTLWGENQKAVEKLLGLPGNYHLATMLLIGVQKGYPRIKIPQIPRRPDFSWMHRNQFGTPVE